MVNFIMNKGKLFIAMVIALIVLVMVVSYNFEKIYDRWTGNSKEQLKISNELKKNTIKDLKAVIKEKENIVVIKKDITKIEDRVTESVLKHTIDNKDDIISRLNAKLAMLKVERVNKTLEEATITDSQIDQNNNVITTLAAKLSDAELKLMDANNRPVRIVTKDKIIYKDRIQEKIIHIEKETQCETSQPVLKLYIDAIHEAYEAK